MDEELSCHSRQAPQAVGPSHLQGTFWAASELASFPWEDSARATDHHGGQTSLRGEA